MGAITRFVIHIELTIMKLASRVVVGCAVVRNFIEAVDVFKAQSVTGAPSHSKLSVAGVESLVVQTVGRWTNVTATDIAREDTFVRCKLPRWRLSFDSSHPVKTWRSGSQRRPCSPNLPG